MMARMMNYDLQTLLAKYDYPVPRYTSYPTAVQFKSNASQGVYKHCLNDLNSGDPVSLYVHIPFCHSLCHYCGCHTKIVHSYSPIQQYIKSLLREIDLTGEVLKQKIPVSRLHFGGGSPNYASSGDLKRIVQRFAEYFDTTDMQIDMECDPRLLNAQKIKDYAALGLSRVSLGIQDFNKSVQEAINRKQPFSLVEEQVSFLREAGIDNINFDLITGLPRQTIDTVRETLEHVLMLRPSRIAVFPYAHVPWIKKHQKLLEKYYLPNTHERFEMGQLVHQVLTAEGYNTIGIDHYALRKDSLSKAQENRTMRRNFQGYTDDPAQTILGFGLSAISQFENAYIQNTTDAPLYRKAIDAAAFPVARSLSLTTEDKRRRQLIERLMCDFTVNFDDFEDIEIPYADLALLEQDSIVEISEKNLYIREEGKPFVRVVASCFDPYFNKESLRHAKAI